MIHVLNYELALQNNDLALPSIEACYGPYSSIDDAYNKIVYAYGNTNLNIPVGLTFAIKDNENNIKEYWFNGGNGKDNIKLKNVEELSTTSITGTYFSEPEVTLYPYNYDSDYTVNKTIYLKYGTPSLIINTFYFKNNKITSYDDGTSEITGYINYKGLDPDECTKEEIIVDRANLDTDNLPYFDFVSEDESVCKSFTGKGVLEKGSKINIDETETYKNRIKLGVLTYHLKTNLGIEFTDSYTVYNEIPYYEEDSHIFLSIDTSKREWRETIKNDYDNLSARQLKMLVYNTEDAKISGSIYRYYYTKVGAQKKLPVISSSVTMTMEYADGTTKTVEGNQFTLSSYKKYISYANDLTGYIGRLTFSGSTIVEIQDGSNKTEEIFNDVAWVDLYIPLEHTDSEIITWFDMNTTDFWNYFDKSTFHCLTAAIPDIYKNNPEYNDDDLGDRILSAKLISEESFCIIPVIKKYHMASGSTVWEEMPTVDGKDIEGTFTFRYYNNKKETKNINYNVLSLDTEANWFHISGISEYECDENGFIGDLIFTGHKTVLDCNGKELTLTVDVETGPCIKFYKDPAVEVNYVNRIIDVYPELEETIMYGTPTIKIYPISTTNPCTYDCTEMKLIARFLQYCTYYDYNISGYTSTKINERLYSGFTCDLLHNNVGASIKEIKNGWIKLNFPTNESDSPIIVCYLNISATINGEDVETTYIIRQKGKPVDAYGYGYGYGNGTVLEINDNSY